jgi:hypothetical protein
LGLQSLLALLRLHQVAPQVGLPGTERIGDRTIELSNLVGQRLDPGVTRLELRQKVGLLR